MLVFTVKMTDQNIDTKDSDDNFQDFFFLHTNSIESLIVLVTEKKLMKTIVVMIIVMKIVHDNDYSDNGHDNNGSGDNDNNTDKCS